MKAVFDARQYNHHPKKEIRYGRWDESDEKPERTEILLKTVKELGIEVRKPQDIDEKLIEEIHTKRYIDFLKSIHQRWSKIKNASRDVYPSVHPNTKTYNYPNSLLGQAGFHLWETGAPVGEQTWQAAKASASTAISAAKIIEDKEDDFAYALCRPPGHHATKETAGGYCYLCNSAIVANYFSKKGKKVAILDVDLHHGNGTQEIFYDRDDVLTISVHVHPDTYFPYFWGFENEKGKGKGEGFNHNLVLNPGATWNEYEPKLNQAIELIKEYKTDILLVGLGLDTHKSDPYGGMELSFDDLEKMGKKIKSVNLPTLTLQEGGYVSDVLDKCLESYLKGIMS